LRGWGEVDFGYCGDGAGTVTMSLGIGWDGKNLVGMGVDGDKLVLSCRTLNAQSTTTMLALYAVLSKACHIRTLSIISEGTVSYVSVVHSLYYGTSS